MTGHIKSTKNFNALIAQLETLVDVPKGGFGFDMLCTFKDRKLTSHPCGTACCIGGHAQAILLSRGAYNEQTVPGAATALRELVGIPEYVDAWNICYPSEEGAVRAGAWLAEPHHAVALLKYYDETGEVDWVKAMGATQ